MARSLVHIVAAQDDGMRLDALAAARELYASRSAAVKAIEDGRVFVNGETVAKKAVVSTGDTIVYEVAEEAPKTHLLGQPIDLDIRYEDDYLIVLSKQVGLVCHPSPDHFDGTLVNALIYHCGADNLCNVQGDRDRLGIVHRLDRDTSGLMLAAKTDDAGQALMDDIRDRIVDRHYLTLVQGVIPHDTGMIDAPIARADRERTRMAVSDSPSARDSITTFTVLERFDAGSKDGGYTLLDCKLFTGRTHQIRVHMNYIKHACVGDPSYGTGSPAAQLGLTRQFLHSYRLAFTHPVTGEDLEFVDGLPEDLSNALESIAERTQGRTEAGEAVLSAIEAARMRETP